MQRQAPDTPPHARRRPAASNWVVPLLGFTAVYLLLVGTVTNQYYQLMLTLVPVWATLGISWNILSGYSGLVSFGHAAFFGLGAYTLTLLYVYAGLSPWFGLPIAGLAGAVAGLVIGYPTFRLRGHYFALSMLAYPLALLYIFEWLGWQEVSLPMNRTSPAAYMQFQDKRIDSLVALAMMIAALMISLRIERTRFGMSLLAIKQNEIAAEAAGIDTFRWKLKAIVLSGMIAGAIGGFYAVVLLIVTPPTVFGMLTSAQALIVALFGGVGSAWGPVIGSAILIPLTEILHAELGDKLPGIQGVVLGMAIILIILFAPEGIFWKVRDMIAKRRSSNAAPDEAVAPSTAAPVVPSGAGQDVPARAPPAPDAPVLLEVEDLSRSFGGLKAVQSVGFSVREGEILGIIGPNGAGKTTLFNLLNGILSADSGTVRYMGQPVLGLPANAVCKLGIGRTFQVVRPFPRLTVLDNVVIGAYTATPSDDEAYELAYGALEKVGMAGDALLLAGGLTTKQLRLLELARALAGNPKLLLLDETLAGLGADAVEDMLGVIRRLAGEGTTIVIIEHTMQAMVRLADRFIVLDHGAVIAEGSPEAVTRDPQVIEAYLGKKWSAYARA
jgi:ABC-type branched-subunit amino acid transport system ATPase component/ABC-type branched-subunit amino acid transport system permease subunit